MSRRPDVPCAGCGKLMYRGKGSLPPGKAVCRSCRNANPVPYGRRDGSPAVAISCPVCGKGFVPQTKRVRACSRSCGQRLRAKRAPSDGARMGRTCEVCSKSYDATYKQQRTCGRECGAILNYRERPTPRVSLKRKAPKWSGPGPSSPVWFRRCRQCGYDFVARTKGARICSDKCRAVRKLQQDPKHVPLSERSCQCGAPLPALGRRTCDSCVHEARRRAKRRRRARERGVISEPYTLAEIAARDRNVCQLCRKRVAMTKQVPHPKAPTIDHVVPLSDGGDDTKANTQLAHFLCNSIKSAGGSQQLALVG